MAGRSARFGALAVLLVAVLLAHSVRRRLAAVRLPHGTRYADLAPDGWALCSAPADGPRIRIAANGTSEECLIVQDGAVLDYGSRQLVQAWCERRGGACDVRELEPGQAALPGLHDAHGHVLDQGWALESVNLVGARSAAEVRERIERYLAARPALAADRERWIEGIGWDQTLWEPAVFPSAKDLSSPALDGRRIALRRVDVHALWLSERALQDVEAAGLPGPGVDIPGGLVLRDAAGRPTGVLIDKAMDYAVKVIPEWTDTDRARFLAAATESLLSVGITSVGDAAVDLASLRFFRDADARGELALRFYGMLACPTAEPRCSGVAAAAGFPLLPQDAAARLTVRTVKLFADGALGSWGSAMWEPYADRPDERGLMLIEPAELRALIAHWLDAGWQCATHCIGDRANSLVLDAYESLLASRPQQDLRLRIEHAQILRLNDTARFGRLGVVASMQPTHATSDMGYVEKRLGAERMQGAYPWQSVLRGGGVLAFGSDFPVELPNPFHGLYSAITRLDAHGHSPSGPGGWLPHERLSRAAALHAFTLGAAYAQFDEQRTGSLERGMRADLIVVDRDILDEAAVTPAQLRETQVLATIVDGRTVWTRR